MFINRKTQQSKGVSSAHIDTGLTRFLTKPFYFVDTDKSILKLLFKDGGTRIAKTILKNKQTNQLHKRNQSISKLYRDIVTKTVWYWQRERHIG